MTQTLPTVPAEGQETIAPIPTLVSVVGATVAHGILAIEVGDEKTADFILSCFGGEGEIVAMFSPEGLRLLEWDSATAINLDIPARVTWPFVGFESPGLSDQGEGDSRYVTDDGAVITATEASASAWVAWGGPAPTVHTYVIGMGEEGFGFGRVDRCEWYWGALPPVDEYLALRAQGAQSKGSGSR